MGGAAPFQRMRARWIRNCVSVPSGLAMSMARFEVPQGWTAQAYRFALVQFLIGRSSRRLRQEFAHLARMKCLWSPSWLVSTVGGAPLEVVRRYVENQKLAAGRMMNAA